MSVNEGYKADATVQRAGSGARDYWPDVAITLQHQRGNQGSVYRHAHIHTNVCPDIRLLEY